MSQRRVCTVFGFPRSTDRDESTRDQRAQLRIRLREDRPQSSPLRLSAFVCLASSGKLVGQSQTGLPAILRGRLGNSAKTPPPREELPSSANTLTERQAEWQLEHGFPFGSTLLLKAVPGVDVDR